MDTITFQGCWTGPDTGPFAAWVADRSAADPVHCIRIDAVGRDPSGRLAVRTEALRGARLPDALDRIGSPTLGVAVTLTVPLLLLAADARSGALLLGDARADDVLVDDAGVTVLVDHPPGADPPGADPSGADSPDLVPRHPHDHARVPEALPVRRSEAPGATALVLAVRAVWERVDPREPCRPEVDAAIATAVDGGVDDVLRLLGTVRATAPPRPVRWDPPRDDFLFEAPDGTATADAGVVGWIRRVVERGVTLPNGRTVPTRRVVVGVVVLAGVVAAGILGVDGARR